MTHAETITCPKTQVECPSSAFCLRLKREIEDGIKPNSSLGRLHAALPSEVVNALPDYCVEERKLALTGLIEASTDPAIESSAAFYLEQIEFSQRFFEDLGS